MNTHTGSCDTRFECQERRQKIQPQSQSHSSCARGCGEAASEGGQCEGLVGSADQLG